MGFWDRMDELVNQGLSSSRELLKQAGDKARDLGEIGLLKYEIGQLERQARDRFTQLGRQVYDELTEKGEASVPRASVSDLLEEIRKLKAEVEKKERELKKVGN
jgi:ubiquinone biosynthesis protein UbiJ